MFLNTLIELEGGYATTYAYDCAWDDATKFDFSEFRTRFGCDKKPFQPHFSLHKSPDIKINPYTGKKMPLQIVPFGTTEITQPRIKEWFTSNQPDYTQELNSEEDAEQFDQEEGINKVYLFSTKKATPPIYQALAANFNNRLRFAVVKKASPISEQLASEFGIDKWPSILINI